MTIKIIEEIIKEFSSLESATAQLLWVKQNPQDATRLLWYYQRWIEEARKSRER